MPDTAPPWLEAMRANDGVKWAPGDGKNPTILEWLRLVSETYPDMASYCASAMSEDYFSWCGLTVGMCMTKAGIAPVFGATDTSRFLFATAWLGWGTPASTPQLGDVVVFDFGGGDHHVTLFEKDNGDGTWSCHGGNQSHQLMLTNFRKSSVMGIRHPITRPAVVPATVTAFAKPASQRFADCVALVLHDEGGNDDDPRDPGGRTSRGITQADWNRWLQTHSGLPADVFQAPQDQIVAIYHQKYWDVLNCDQLAAGVDYAVFDYGVLSGVGRAAKVLQGLIGAEVDGEIGPDTIAAAARANGASLVNQICDERLAFLKGLTTFATFGKGWTARVERVRKVAAAMVSSAPPPVIARPSEPPSKPVTPAGATQMTPDEIAQALMHIVTAVAAQQGPAGQAGLPVPAANNVLQILNSFLATQQGAGGQAVQSQDVLKSLMASLLLKQQQATAGQAAPAAAQDIGQLILSALRGKQIPISLPAPSGPSADPSTVPSSTTPPVLTTIDKMLGGETLAGKKTLIAFVGFAIQMLLQFSGVPGIGIGVGQNAGNVIGILLGSLGGLGILSKTDRVVQLLGMIAKAQAPAVTLPVK
jgi:uncharacterized protein (TIGR02594 family)